MNFYNENNAFAAAWLRELIRANLIAPGVVDERSITDLDFNELKQYRQCHFFAGIGGWSYALRLAGWPDDEPVWTGSCPCQPFSIAGKGEVDQDERHVWPAFREAIAIGRPAICFGEQVASKDGRIWLAGVRTDLEAMGYAVGGADLCSAGVSAPHLRQRLNWLAYAIGSERWTSAEGRRDVAHWENTEREKTNGGRAVCGSPLDRLGKPDSNRRQSGSETAAAAGHGRSVDPTARRDSAKLANADRAGREELNMPALSERAGHDPGPTDPAGMADTNNYHRHWWSGPLQVGRNCIEGEIERGGRKYRAQWRIKPGLSLLADGVPGRVGQLCGFGNAINPILTAEFIEAACEAINLTYGRQTEIPG